MTAEGVLRYEVVSGRGGQRWTVKKVWHEIYINIGNIVVYGLKFHNIMERTYLIPEFTPSGEYRLEFGR